MKKSSILVIVLLLLTSVAVSIPVASAQQINRDEVFRYLDTNPGPLEQLNPLNPLGGPFVYGDFSAPCILYESLAYLDQYSGKMKPCLAESWSWIDDTTFEIKIQPLAHWRDGSPVTADDVVFSYEANSTYGGGTPLPAVDRMEAVDAKTVHVILKEEYPRNSNVYSFLHDTANWLIIQKARWTGLIAQYGENNIASEFTNIEHPDEIEASGPYTLDTVTATGAIFKRVDDYWGEALGWYSLPEYVEYVYCTSNDTQIRAIETHDIDWFFLGHYDTDFYKGRQNYLASWNIGGAPSDMFMNEASYYGIIGNLADEQIRECQPWLTMALAYATDKQKVIDDALSGLGLIGSPSQMHPLTPGFDELVNNEAIESTYPEVATSPSGYLYIPYDPAIAVEILENHGCTGSIATGWTYNGHKLGPWTVKAVSGWGDTMAVAAIAAANWTAIGIPTEPDYPEFAKWMDDWSTANFSFMMCWFREWFLGPTALTDAFQANFVGPHLNIWTSNGGGYKYEQYSAGAAENTAGEVKDLVTELYGLELLSDEYIATVKEIQSIVVPQVPSIAVLSKACPEGMITDRWVNYPRSDDPYEARWNESNPAFYIKHVYPRAVRTVDFSLSPGTVEAGNPTTARVTLVNDGDVGHRYAIYLTEGYAIQGTYGDMDVFGGSTPVVAHKCVTVPAHGTVTAELQVSFTSAGSHVVTVDAWRVNEEDPGDPISQTLTVTPTTHTTTTTTTTTTTAPPTTTTTTTAPPTTTTTHTTTTTAPPTTTTAAPPSEAWTWVAVGIAVIVVIAIVALIWTRRK